MSSIPAPIANSTLQETFLAACESRLPTGQYQTILSNLIPFWVLIGGDRRNYEASLRLKNDFWIIQYTSSDRFRVLMSKVMRKNNEILGIGADTADLIIADMLWLLKEIFREKSSENPIEYTNALHALANLVLEKPAEFIKIFMQLTPGEWVPEKVRYLQDRGIDISIATGYRHIAKKDGHNHKSALLYLNFLLQERYSLLWVQINPCKNKDCTFPAIQAERMAEVERILDLDENTKIQWNMGSIREEFSSLKEICDATMYRWFELRWFSLAIVLASCNQVPRFREKESSRKKKRVSTTSSTNPESL